MTNIFAIYISMNILMHVLDNSDEEVYAVKGKERKGEMRQVQ